MNGLKGWVMIRWHEMTKVESYLHSVASSANGEWRGFSTAHSMQYVRFCYRVSRFNDYQHWKKQQIYNNELMYIAPHYMTTLHCGSSIWNVILLFCKCIAEDIDLCTISQSLRQNSCWLTFMSSHSGLPLQ